MLFTKKSFSPRNILVNDIKTVERPVIVGQKNLLK
jgi:hypothetical protein